MSDSNDTQAAPSSNPDATEEGVHDPIIAALLNFEPAPRQNKRKNGWTPALQRMFIAELAQTGSPNLAAEALGKSRYGVEKVSKSEGAEGFRAAWDAAVALYEERDAQAVVVRSDGAEGRPPFVDRRRRNNPSPSAPWLEGQVLNEYGEWEDENSIVRRAEEARNSVTRKVLNARRHYLHEISGCPGKRAAFEMLTDLPIDWDKAARFEPQEDEPFRTVVSMRSPEMLLTAENGWMGDVVHGRDKKAELKKQIDDWREEEGLEPVDWSREPDDREEEPGAW